MDQKTSTEMNKLPFLISIPHGGTAIPEELTSRINLSPQELFADGDPYTGDIYDVSNEVVSQIQFDIARALIDVNRAPDDLPSGNPDGVIKTVSIFNNPVYQNSLEPNEEETNLLLNKYYEPFHAAIRDALTKPNILFAFDCHSMEAVGPPVARDAGSKRPLFCLGNNNGKACSEKNTQLLAECICKSFELPKNEVTINEPFSGGYITQQYGNHPVPWIQVEMNRGLYMTQPCDVSEIQSADPNKIQKLNTSFRLSLKLFLERYDFQDN